MSVQAFHIKKRFPDRKHVIDLLMVKDLEFRAISPFRGEKDTNWEGGYRVPCLVRWPGKIPAGKISNEIMSMQDGVPTLMAAAGEPDMKEKLK